MEAEIEQYNINGTKQRMRVPRWISVKALAYTVELYVEEKRFIRLCTLFRMNAKEGIWSGETLWAATKGKLEEN